MHQTGLAGTLQLHPLCGSHFNRQLNVLVQHARLRWLTESECVPSLNAASAGLYKLDPRKVSDITGAYLHTCRRASWEASSVVLATLCMCDLHERLTYLFANGEHDLNTNTQGTLLFPHPTAKCLGNHYGS